MNEPDDTDMTPAEFRAAMGTGVPVEIVTSRQEYEAYAAREQAFTELVQQGEELGSHEDG